MKHFLRIAALVATLIAFCAFTYFATSWKIDPNYSIKFSTSSAEGSFSGLSGTVVFDKNSLNESKLDVQVKVNTIETGNDTKNDHARGDNWFEAEKYPTIQFTSSSIKAYNGAYLASGTLHLHGVKKEVFIPFQFLQEGEKARLQGSFTVNREDYGIEGGFFGFTVGSKVEVTFNVPLS